MTLISASCRLYMHCLIYYCSDLYIIAIFQNIILLCSSLFTQLFTLVESHSQQTCIHAFYIIYLSVYGSLHTILTFALQDSLVDFFFDEIFPHMPSFSRFPVKSSSTQVIHIFVQCHYHVSSLQKLRHDHASITSSSMPTMPVSRCDQCQY